MNQVSVAGTGVYVVLITALLNLIGITPEPDSIMAVVNAGAIIFGWVLVVIGQFKRKDLKMGLIRK